MADVKPSSGADAVPQGVDHAARDAELAALDEQNARDERERNTIPS